MKIYLKFISMSFQKSIAYRIEYFTSLLNALLYIFIFVSIWKSLIPKEGMDNGITQEMMISYAVLSTLIKSSFGRSQGFISSKVRSGEIAVELMKPYSLPLIYLGDIIGNSLFQLLARSIPLFLFCIMVFDIHFKVTLNQFYLFLFFYFLSFFLYYFISLFISSLSFYFVEIFPFWILYFAMITLLSGAIIPIDFFPLDIQNLVLNTPFPYLFYFPTMILLKSNTLLLSYDELLIKYLQNLLMIGILSVILYKSGIKKLTVAGG